VRQTAVLASEARIWAARDNASVGASCKRLLGGVGSSELEALDTHVLLRSEPIKHPVDDVRSGKPPKMIEVALGSAFRKGWLPERRLEVLLKVDERSALVRVCGPEELEFRKATVRSTEMKTKLALQTTAGSNGQRVVLVGNTT
jgi:hypothetical protein